MDASGLGGDGGVHGGEEEGVGVEGDEGGGPVEAVFVVGSGGGEGQGVEREGWGCGGGVGEGGDGGLEDEVDGVGGCVGELAGEEFEVDFLGVVVVLCWEEGGGRGVSVLMGWGGRGGKERRKERREGEGEEMHTQKKAPHVPGVPVNFIEARKLPYNISSRVLATSAIGMSPSCGIPPRTQSCNPGSPPKIPSPVQLLLSLSGLATTFPRDAFLP